MSDPQDAKQKRTWLQWLCRPSTLIGMLFLFLVFVAPFAFRAWRLSRVIAIRDFDHELLINRASAIISSSTNAADDFRRGISKKVNYASEIRSELDAALAWNTEEISTPFMQWVIDNEDAVQAWRIGTNKNNFAEIELKDASFITLLYVSSEARDFTRLMLLKAKSEYHEGNIPDAFEWQRSAFRGALLISQNGVFNQKLTAFSCMHMVIEKGLVPLLGDDSIDEEMLRKMQRQLQDDYQELHVPTSETIKAEAIMFENTMNDSNKKVLLNDLCKISTGGAPEFLIHLAMFFAAEPELSLKLHRQYNANLLSQCDLPPYKKNLAKGISLELYTITSPPPQPGMMTPEQIAATESGTLFYRLNNTINQYHAAFDHMDGKYAAFNVAFLIEIYRRRHGSYPATLSNLDADLRKELPVDPCTGKDLILKIIPDAATAIYSVGHNFRDDGGDFENSIDAGFQLGVIVSKAKPVEE